MVKNLNKDLDRAIKEIKEFIDESKHPKEKNRLHEKAAYFPKGLSTKACTILFSIIKSIAD